MLSPDHHTRTALVADRRAQLLRCAEDAARLRAVSRPDRPGPPRLLRLPRLRRPAPAA
jgi:hypothetical protein